MPIGLDGMRYVTSRPGKGGDLRWYWQRKGYPVERLPDDEIERHRRAKELNDAADRGELPKKKEAPRDNDLNLLAGIIRDYKESPAFTTLKPGTRKNYERTLTELRDIWGNKRVSLIDQTLCIDYLEAVPLLSERRAARAVLRCVLKRAVYRRKLPFNPTDGIELPTPPARQELFIDDELKAFVAGCRKHETHGFMAYVGFMLLLFTGQRPGDMLQMAWTQYNGRTVRLRQEKTGKWVEVPAHPELKQVLDAMRRDGVVIMTHNGRPVSEKTFNYRFNEVKRSVELGSKQARDLRRTAVVRMAEGGAELQDIAAVTGHSIEHTRKILEVYLPRTLKMAQRGVERMGTLSLTF